MFTLKHLNNREPRECEGQARGKWDETGEKLTVMTEF